MWKLPDFFAKLTSPSAPSAPKGAKGGGTQTLVPMTNDTVMPTVMTPKVANKQQTTPSYAPTNEFIAAPLLRRDSNTANVDIASLARGAPTTPAVIRALARLTPDLSAAVSAYLRVGIPEEYTAVARNMDGTFNRDATALAQNILRQIDLMPDYASGFSQVSSLRSLMESLGKELVIEGACAMELVLDKNRMPYKFQPVSTTQIIFREDKNVQGIFPQQLLGGVYIDLDQPTFFYTSVDQDLLTAYATSPLEGAVQPVLAAAAFANDMRRIAQRHVFPRYDIIIDEEKLRERIPASILAEEALTNAYLVKTVADIQTLINAMGPEEALVHFDFITVQYVAGGEADNAGAFETVKDIYDAKVSTGAKTLPSILGHGAGSQNVASSETMIFMLSANGLVRLKLNEIISKAMTLAVRLFGLDVTVEFKLAPINLRPDSEMESFRAMKQARILEQLSLGFLTDDEASIALNGELTPAGFAPLCGTGFFTPITGAGEQSNPAVSGDGAAGNQQGALNQSLKSDAPSKPKGGQKK